MVDGDWNLRWGKRTKDEKPYLVDGHLIDTGVVAEMLWDRYFEPHTKRWLIERLGPTARQRFALLAATHDCGKLAPTFQCRLLDRKQPAWVARFSESDLPGWPGTTDVRTVHQRDRSFLAHATESGRTLARFGANGWWSRVVEGHHGRFPMRDEPPPRTLASAQRSIERSSWPAAQEALLARVTELFSPGESFEELDRADLEAIAAVQATGWVSVADWLASDESAVESGAAEQALIDNDIEAFVTVRREYFKGQLERALGTYNSPGGDFRSVFGFAPDRPVQRFTSTDSQPDFCALAVPMGAGKTEAALERHRRLDVNSLYFALPTMATADAMFERIQSFYGASETTTGALLHGRASINDFYAGAADVGFDHAGDRTTGLVASQWLQGRHRGLLAPVGVGTVDQILASVLRARYATVRLAAAANTHIVFDEVHSYDPYQQQLFAVVLRWLGTFRAPVTLLSATLPSELAARYADSYRSGWQCRPAKAHDVEPLSYPGAVTASNGEPAKVASIEPSDARTIRFEYHESCDSVVDVLVDRIRNIRQLAPGAVIGVIVNRVATCISVALAVSDMSPLVLHARMPTAMRSKRQAEVAELVGPGSAASGQLVVGTQVLEQSLDIDFDHLITEFAPAPDLLQRTGRLWRHSRCLDGDWIHPAGRRRTHAGAEPTVTVVVPSEFSDRSSRPYMLGVMIQSWTAGFGSGSIAAVTVPDDLQRIVDASHVTFKTADMEDPATADLMASVRAKRAAALDRAIPIDELLDDLGCEMLPDVTAGVGDVDDERATRWQDQPSETIALVSRSIEWAMTPDSLQLGARERAKAIINASLGLSGGPLRHLEPELTELHEIVDRPTRRPLGRYLNLDNSRLARLDQTLGLVLEERPETTEAEDLGT